MSQIVNFQAITAMFLIDYNDERCHLFGFGILL